MIPNVHEFNREIPAGKVLLAEYRDLTETDRRCRYETLETRMAGFKGKTEYRLQAKHAGWNIAGSVMRWDNGAYVVLFEFDNATHGRSFLTYEEAKTHFDNVKSY